MKNNNYNRNLGPDETIPLWFDKLFKLVFGDSNHLERTKFLISSVLDLEINKIELINSEIIEDNRMDKVNTVDLAVKVDEAFVSIEANSSFGEIVRDRNLVFMFKIQGRSLKPGDEYRNLGKTYQINFNQEDFDGEYFNVCHIRSDNTGLLYSKKTEIYNINVKHYAEVCYNGHMDELSETEKLFALIGVNKKSVIDMLITDSNVLKEIGIMAKKYSGDKVILESYNREELLKADMENEFSKKEELLKADMENEFSKKEELLKADMENEFSKKEELLKADMENEFSKKEELLKADMENEFSKKKELLKADMERKFSKKEELLKADMENEFSKKKELLKADMESKFKKKLASDIASNTEKVALDMARKMKKQGIIVSDIEIITGLSKDVIDKL